MLIKWILCTVKPEDKAAFSQAQESWSHLHGVDGFCGQIGGWKTDAELQEAEAHIAGLWRDRETYQTFMEEVHDRITDGSGQSKTYTAIRVTLEEVREEELSARLQVWQDGLELVAGWTVVSSDERWDTGLPLGSH